MTGLAIKIQLSGLSEAGSRLAALQALGEDLTPLMRAVGGLMVDSTVARFESETEPDGTPWMPSYRAVHEGGKTLSRTGRLKQSFDSQADSSSVEWGSNVQYAAPLHFGAVIEAKKGKALAFTGVEGHLVFAQNVVLPARPMVGFTSEDSAAIEDLVAAFIADLASSSP